MVESAYIEGVHGIPLAINGISYNLYSFVKAIKCSFFYNGINKMSSLNYYRQCIKGVNERRNDH